MAYPPGKILVVALALSVMGLAAGPVAAQSQSSYGFKPFDGRLAATPANGLDKVIRSEKSGPGANIPQAKPDGAPVVRLHAYGAVMVESTLRR
jgi:hypothetical protein